MKRITLKIDAILEIDPSGNPKIERWSLDELQGVIWEIHEISAPVSLQIGGSISGKIRFIQPTPYELKLAELEAGEKR